MTDTVFARAERRDPHAPGVRRRPLPRRQGGVRERAEPDEDLSGSGAARWDAHAHLRAVRRGVAARLGHESPAARVARVQLAGAKARRPPKQAVAFNGRAGAAASSPPPPNCHRRHHRRRSRRLGEAEEGGDAEAEGHAAAAADVAPRTRRRAARDADDDAASGGGVVELSRCLWRRARRGGGRRRRVWRVATSGADGSRRRRQRQRRQRPQSGRLRLQPAAPPSGAVPRRRCGMEQEAEAALLTAPRSAANVLGAPSPRRCRAASILSSFGFIVCCRPPRCGEGRGGDRARGARRAD